VTAARAGWVEDGGIPVCLQMQFNSGSTCFVMLRGVHTGQYFLRGAHRPHARLQG